jgi:predicted dehydrogenase
MEEYILYNLSSHQFRVGILGAGNISSEHADALNWLPNTELVAVCDLDHNRAKALADKYHIHDVYFSIDEMLKKSKLDVVHVLLQPGSHVKFAIKCLQAGSHVFLEKPIGITTSECRDLLNVSKLSDLSVGVNHNMVYFPAVQSLIDQVRKNKFGRIVHVNIAYSMPPSKILNIAPGSFFLQAPQNPLLEWAVHPLSIIYYLLGEVNKAKTLLSGKHYTNTGHSFYKTWQSSLECDRGTSQLLISVGEGFDYLWMDVLGEDAFAHVDLLNDSIVVSDYSPYRPAVAKIRDAYIKSNDLFKSAFWNMKNYFLAGIGRPVDAESTFQAGMRNSMRAFYNALSNNITPPQGIEHGKAVIEYCEQIFQSTLSTS